MIPRMIFGMGTGRCGTYTLFRILEAQEGVASSHEGIPMPWKIDICQLWYHLLRMAVHFDGDVIANVSFVWINYVGYLMGNLKDPRCVCLKRPKHEVIDSFCKYIPGLNYWTDPGSRHWNPNKDTQIVQNDRILWPKYDLPKKDAIGQYWEDYYAHAKYFEQRYPENFLTMDMYEALNTQSGQRRMLSFIGIKNNQRIFLNNKLNTAKNPKGALNHVYA